MEIFAKRLKGLRDERELTARYMATVLKMSPRAYLRYEKNTSEPTQENLVKIAKFFGVTADYLLGMAEV